MTQTQGALISEPKLVITMFMGPRWREKVRCLGNSQEAAAKNVPFLTSYCCCLDGISGTAVKSEGKKRRTDIPWITHAQDSFNLSHVFLGPTDRNFSSKYRPEDAGALCLRL